MRHFAPERLEENCYGASSADLAAVRLGYTETTGNPELREAIAATYDEVSSDDVVVLSSPEEFSLKSAQMA